MGMCGHRYEHNSLLKSLMVVGHFQTDVLSANQKPNAKMEASQPRFQK